MNISPLTNAKTAARNQFKVMDIRLELAKTQPKDLQNLTRSQHEKIQSLKGELGRLQKLLVETQQRTALLEEDYIHMINLYGHRR